MARNSQPWERASDPDVEPEINSDSGSYDALFKDFPRIGLLPPELVYAIRAYCHKSLYWVPSRIEYLKRTLLQPTKQAGLQCVPLTCVQYWSRHQEPVLTAPAKTGWVIRITLDLNGIRCIERLNGLPTTGAKSASRYFAVYDTVIFQNTLLCLRDNIAHLQFTGACLARFRLWDTPCPPSVPFSLRHVSKTEIPLFVQTVSLKGCTGLTFLMDSLIIYAMHVHTASQPSAQITADQLTAKRRKSVVWLYVPVRGGITKLAMSPPPREAPRNRMYRLQSILVGFPSVADARR